MCSVHLHAICSISVPHYHFTFLENVSERKVQQQGLKFLRASRGVRSLWPHHFLENHFYEYEKGGRQLYFKRIMSKHFAAYRIHKSCNNWQHLGRLSDETFLHVNTLTLIRVSQLFHLGIETSRLSVLVFFRTALPNDIYRLENICDWSQSWNSDIPVLELESWLLSWHLSLSLQFLVLFWTSIS